MDPNAGWFGRLQQNVVVGVLRRLDRLPRHIGIIMDGNRRYARMHGADRKAGHSSGFDTMSRILAVAYSAGVAEVSVYAFSIENFHRSDEEVADLMEIARTRLRELVSYHGLAEQYGVRINVIGHLALLPADIATLAHEIMDLTAKNNHATLNLCMPYTARDDMAQAVAAAAAAAAPRLHAPPTPVTNTPPGTADKTAGITIDDVAHRLRTRESLPLDLLIRTSNTFRLSDFMLWEVNDLTYIDFVAALWPEYTPVQLLATILRWRFRGAR